MANNKVDLIFEVSWEVCNKVGGIYTVLSSKSKILNTRYPDGIIFIGPDFGNETCNGLFIPDPKPAAMFSDLSLPLNIKFRTGRWNIPGSPIVLLVDFKGVYNELNSIYGRMWETFKVDSLHAYGDYDESCAFAIAAAILIGNLSTKVSDRYHKIIALFNEWTTGMGLLYLKIHFPGVATVFTTHATSIGRSICGNNKPLYGYFEGYNGDQMAGELNMQSKHSLEKMAAHNADCFTAVSEITAREAGQLLEKRPHIVTPNGFEKALSGTKALRASNRRNGRKRILEIARALTGKTFSDDTFIIATSGRNEFRNKGVDVFLDSMKDLNDKGISRYTIALTLVPAWVKEPRTELVAAMNGDKRVGVNNRFITHNLNNPESDSIFRRIAELNFNLEKDGKVSVIYIPCYLDGDDGVVNISYYDLLPALDLTVFPSYYEPWGYTPLESIAFGVPTVTTSLSGFGQWVKERFAGENIEKTGVAVIERDDFNYHEAVESIADVCLNLMSLDPEVYGRIRENALLTASEAQWSKFIKHYYEAFAVALENNSKSTKQNIQ